jgi:ATP-dependent RNA helicase DeaD
MQSFETLGLSKEIVGAIHKLGFEKPTPIQEQAIPILLEGNQDVVALAQTGTGKTAAFGLPLVDLIDDRSKTTQALVLAPTRELCMQITSDFHNFTKSVKLLNIVPVYGGASIAEQIRSIKKGAQIIVATPGRLMDLLERKVINLREIRFVVLDEADEMLNMGFKEDIDHILSHTAENKNVWLFSATMPREVREIASNYMNKPVELQVGEKNQSNQNIEHQYMIVDDKDRYPALKRIVDYNLDIFGVIFCRTKVDTQRVAEHLIKDGYNADSLHGDLTQQQRDRVMRNFKSKALQLLVATDVAARGIDVSNLTHVIHMNLPDEIEFYTHRSGRTARAGKKGISIALINKRETQKIRQIEKLIQSKFTHKLVPSGAEVCEKRVINIVHRLREVSLNEKEIAGFLPTVYEALQDLSKEEIIKRFTSLEFNHFLDYYRDAPDLNRSDKSDRSERADRGDRESSRGHYVTGDRLFINLGKMDGLDAGKLLGLICDRAKINKAKIGKMDLKGAYSFFEIDKEHVQAVRDHLHGFEYKGRMVRIEVTEASGDGVRSSSGGGRRREETTRSTGGRDRERKRTRR